jgi:hypothetical protein
MYEPHTFLDEFEDLSGDEFLEEHHQNEMKHKQQA